jgi:hypothetical protein
MAFKSGFERTININLLSRGVDFKYEGLKLPYIIDHVYNPDFILSNGIIIEAKGYFRTPSEIAKMRTVKKTYPELDIRFVFMYADKKIPRQKQTHEQWATRHGFPYAIGLVPEEWINE